MPAASLPRGARVRPARRIPLPGRVGLDRCPGRGSGRARGREVPRADPRADGRAGGPGLAVALVDRHRVLWAEGFGDRDDHGDPVTTDTIFGLQSMSKLFTATAVMQAVEAGPADLDEPITTYLPEFTTDPSPRSGSWPIEETPDSGSRSEGLRWAGAVARSSTRAARLRVDATAGGQCPDRPPPRTRQRETASRTGSLVPSPNKERSEPAATDEKHRRTTRRSDDGIFAGQGLSLAVNRG